MLTINIVTSGYSLHQQNLPEYLRAGEILCFLKKNRFAGQKSTLDFLLNVSGFTL